MTNEDATNKETLLMPKVNDQETRIKSRDYEAGKVKRPVDFLNGWAPAKPGIPTLTEAERRVIMRIDIDEERAERARPSRKSSRRNPGLDHTTRADSERFYYVPGDPLDPVVYAGLVVCKTVRSVAAGRLLGGLNKVDKARATALIERTAALPLKQKIAVLSEHHDLRPEWIEQILANPSQNEFAFAEQVE